MNFLRNVWYQAGWSDEIAPGQMLTRTILGNQLLFFRDKDGVARALHDRCPHRFAPLSAGKLENGVVSCGYHGLSFNGLGQCVRNPHGAVAGSIRVEVFSVVERHQVLWIWMGQQERADTNLIPDLSFIDQTPQVARIRGLLPTAAHYQLLIDNIMDLSHADYLHPATLGGIMTGASTRVRTEADQIVVDYVNENCVPPPSFYSLVPPPLKADIWIQVRWFAAGVMVLAAGANPTGSPRGPEQISYTLHSMTPETSSQTLYFYCSTRAFQTDNEQLSASLKDILEQAFVKEDKPMLEKQQARVGEVDLWSLKPLLLPIDSAAVHVRRKLSKLLEAEKA